MPIPRKGQTRSEAEFVLASEDVARLKDEVGELVETALGVSWYAAYGNQSDAAALASRAISYMDESGYPEAVEPWFPEPAEP